MWLERSGDGGGGLTGGLEGGGEGSGGEQALELGGGARGPMGGGEQLGAARALGGGSGGVVVGCEGFFVGQRVPGGGQDGVLGLHRAQAQRRQVVGLVFCQQGGLDGAQVAGDGAAVEVEGAGDGGDGAAFAIERVDAMAQRERGVGQLVVAARRVAGLGRAQGEVFVFGGLVGGQRQRLQRRTRRAGWDGRQGGNCLARLIPKGRRGGGGTTGN